jgi:hypothetical protein
MEPEVLVPYSLKLSTGPYPEEYLAFARLCFGANRIKRLAQNISSGLMGKCKLDLKSLLYPQGTEWSQWENLFRQMTHFMSAKGKNQSIFDLIFH